MLFIWSLLQQGSQPTLLVFGRDWKADSGVGKLFGGKKEGRLGCALIGGCWRGRGRQTLAMWKWDVVYFWLMVHICMIMAALFFKIVTGFMIVIRYRNFYLTRIPSWFKSSMLLGVLWVKYLWFLLSNINCVFWGSQGLMRNIHHCFVSFLFLIILM